MATPTQEDDLFFVDPLGGHDDIVRGHADTQPRRQRRPSRASHSILIAGNLFSAR